MIKDIIYQYKAEKEYLLTREYIAREGLESARKFLDSDIVKTIVGPRRSGKSVFSLLLLKDKNFAYLNFDDENLMKIRQYDDMLKAIIEVYREVDFIFFDEIQNLENWEIYVNKLQRRGYNLVLTGSNAKLLSRELGTTLTGRYVPFEILPFSFREFLAAKKFQLEEDSLKLPVTKGKILNFLSLYLRNGGFPEVTTKDLDVKAYLSTLFDAIIFKDIVKRYKIRFSQEIYELSLYLISNFSCQFTFNRLRNILGFRSTVTLQKYMNYLQEAYLIFILNRFSFKMKEQLKTPRKIYVPDNGYIQAKAFQSSQNLGKLMENSVCIENIRRGHSLNDGMFYYQSKNGRETDFILREGTKITELQQVCYEIDNPATKERESRAIVQAADELGCDLLTVITWDYEAVENYKGKILNFTPLWKWLLR
ncbi:MAG: ATP-binding protein [Candidatus Xenobiia bacterium LiM19]